MVRILFVERPLQGVGGDVDSVVVQVDMIANDVVGEPTLPREVPTPVLSCPR
jgi:hypothetical protein